MTSRILLALFLFIVSSVFANTITRGYVLQVHRDGRVANVPLGRGQPLVGISMPNTEILTVGALICCNYSGAEVFTLMINHQYLTQSVFIVCSSAEFLEYIGLFHSSVFSIESLVL